MAETIAELLARYGYLAVLAGTFLEGETVLVLASYGAHRGLLDLRLVLLCAFVGATAGDQFWFVVGRRLGGRLLARPSWQARRAKLDARLEKHRDWLVLASRFMIGLRIVTPVVLGTTTLRLGRFVLLNIIGAVGWTALFGALGYAFGVVVEHWLHQTAGAQLILLGAIFVAVAVVHWWRRRGEIH